MVTLFTFFVLYSFANPTLCCVYVQDMCFYTVRLDGQKTLAGEANPTGHESDTPFATPYFVTHGTRCTICKPTEHDTPEQPMGILKHNRPTKSKKLQRATSDTTTATTTTQSALTDEVAVLARSTSELGQRSTSRGSIVDKVPAMEGDRLSGGDSTGATHSVEAGLACS